MPRSVEVAIVDPYFKKILDNQEESLTSNVSEPEFLIYILGLSKHSLRNSSID